MSAVLTTLFSFDLTNGANPFGGLIVDANGDLFGTTTYAGPNGAGTVFELVNNNGTYTLNTLVAFNGNNGGLPLASLIADANGDLFGTTGLVTQKNSNNDVSVLNYGTVFELINNNGTYTLDTLLNFSGGNGANPQAGLIADVNGDLFGTTSAGGLNNAGTVFELVNNNGTYTLDTLLNFSGGNGANPLGGLIADGNGDLFGTTQYGGSNNDGTVFELVNNNGSYTLNTLLNFNGGNGAQPNGNLLADARGDLFGTTHVGGSNNLGTVFELVNNNGTYTLNTLLNFNGSNGAYPFAGLIADANGDLFGTTGRGGSNNDGTIFELINNNGSYTLNTLISSNGPFTETGLIADANGDLFSTTAYGPTGAISYGTVFEITNSGFAPVPLDHWTNTRGGDWSSAANWNPGVPTAGKIADIDVTGTYSVAITTNDVAYGLWVNDAQATVSDNNNGSLTLAGQGGAANPNGSLNIDAGTFVLNGGAFKAGTIFIDSGGRLLLAKGTYTGLNAISETITDNGSLTDNTTATITGNISGTGNILAENTANLTFAGTLTGSENFTLANSAHVFISNSVNGTGSFVIANAGRLEFGAADNENITFASGAKGMVKFDHSLTTPFTGTIFGLTPKDSIDLADLTYVAGKMKATYDSSAGTLTVTNGSQSVGLKLSGNYTNATWVLSKDATGGTRVVDPPANTSPPTSSLDSLVAGDQPMTTDVFAYATTGPYNYVTGEYGDPTLFGIVDLTTGVFTALGNLGLTLGGLAVGPGGALYGGAGQTLYSVNPTNGALTAVGTSSLGYYDVGSTTSGLFEVGTDFKLYSINPNTGALTLIGPTGLNYFNGLSTGSDTLYLTSGSTLYTLNTTTGAATLVGSAGSGVFGAVVVEGGIIYGGSASPLAIYTLDGTTGAGTLLADVSGATSNLWGLAPIQSDTGPETTEAPSLTVSSSLSVSPGTSIPMGITASPVDSDDAASITIKGVPSYETITAGPGETVTHKGTTYTITSTTPGASINDLTLTSFYTGKKSVVSTMAVTASNTTSGEAAITNPKTVTVTDPPTLVTNDNTQRAANSPINMPPSSSFGLNTAQTTTGVTGDASSHTPPGLDHVIALFNQYAAAGFPHENGMLFTNPVSNPLAQIVANEQQFLAQPHHG